jgi:hypothetical protein
MARLLARNLKQRSTVRTTSKPGSTPGIRGSPVPAVHGIARRPTNINGMRGLRTLLRMMRPAARASGSELEAGFDTSSHDRSGRHRASLRYIQERSVLMKTLFTCSVEEADALTCKGLPPSAIDMGEIGSGAPFCSNTHGIGQQMISHGIIGVTFLTCSRPAAANAHIENCLSEGLSERPPTR